MTSTHVHCCSWLVGWSRGRFFDTDLVFDQQLKLLGPSDRQLKCSHTIVFELFRVGNKRCVVGVTSTIVQQRSSGVYFLLLYCCIFVFLYDCMCLLIAFIH